MGKLPVLYIPMVANAAAIFGISAVILGFTLDNVVYFAGDPDNLALQPDLPTPATSIDIFPKEVGIAAVWALFATAIGGLIDSALLVGVLVWCARAGKFEKIFTSFHMGIVLIIAISLIRSLAIMVFAFVDYGNSDSFDISLVNADGSYPGEASGFALESWVRQVAEFLVEGDRQSRLATELRASRGLAVSATALYAIEMIFALLTWRTQSVRYQPVPFRAQGKA